MTAEAILELRAQPRVVPFGDRALLAVLGDGVDPALNRRVHALAARIRAAHASQPGWGMPVPAYASVLAPFDPDRLDPARAEADLTAWLQAALAGEPAPDAAMLVVEIPVRYGGEHGPDLDEVAERLGLTPAQVIEAHAATTYRVFLLGFRPGFAYLGTLPAALALPRRPEPRPRVPAGSVGIAARQTAVYPFETPGGWHLIGRTNATLWDLRQDPPAVLRVGERVRFVPEPG
ncbi:MAG: 5-oxoprolinase subunit PxpB [Chloroflexota bacterium]